MNIVDITPLGEKVIGKVAPYGDGTWEAFVAFHHRRRGFRSVGRYTGPMEAGLAVNYYAGYGDELPKEID